VLRSIAFNVKGSCLRFCCHKLVARSGRRALASPGNRMPGRGGNWIECDFDFLRGIYGRPQLGQVAIGRQHEGNGPTGALVQLAWPGDRIAHFHQEPPQPRLGERDADSPRAGRSARGRRHAGLLAKGKIEECFRSNLRALGRVGGREEGDFHRPFLERQLTGYFPGQFAERIESHIVIELLDDPRIGLADIDVSRSRDRHVSQTHGSIRDKQSFWEETAIPKLTDVVVIVPVNGRDRSGGESRRVKWPGHQLDARRGADNEFASGN
jgi:hypothetical protein